MFGLVFLVCVVLVGLSFLALGAIVYGVTRRLKLSRGSALATTIAVVLVAIIAPHLHDMSTIHLYNKLCATQAGRKVREVIQDVEGVRVDGNPTAEQQLLITENYGFSEWAAASGLRWRSNRFASEVCGQGKACNVHLFSARYVIVFRAEMVTSRIRRIDQKAIDSRTGAVLGTDETFSMSGDDDGAPTLGSWLRVAWELPLLLWEKPVERCSPSNAVSFANTVLVPRSRNSRTSPSH